MKGATRFGSFATVRATSVPSSIRSNRTSSCRPFSSHANNVNHPFLATASRWALQQPPDASISEYPSISSYRSFASSASSRPVATISKKRRKQQKLNAMAKASLPSTYPTTTEAVVTPSTNTDDTETIRSNRRQFKDTPVPTSIKNYLEMIGVGIPSQRKRSKRSRSALFHQLESGRRSGRTGSYTKPPPPFSTGGDLHQSDGTVSRDDADGIQQERKVVVIGSVAHVDDTLPTNKERIPEVALAGRSNVGKSTLLNALLYGNHPRRARNNSGDAGDNDGSSYQHTTNPLVRHFRRGHTPTNVKLPKGIKAVTSEKPGETRKITFYQLASRQGDTNSTGTSANLDDEQHQENPQNHRDQKNDLVKLRLVDLPGYGFSFTPKEHDGFQDLLLQYLLDRGKALKRVLLLLDGRHGMKKADVDFIETLQEQAFAAPGKKTLPPIQIVLTKCDLVPRDDLARRVVLVRQQLSDILWRETSALPVLAVSARAGVGYNNIRGGRHLRAKGGVLELQKELAALVPQNKKK